MLPRLLNKNEVEEILNYCLYRYEVSPFVFENYKFLKRKEGVWLHPKDITSGDINCEIFETSGLRILSGKEFPYKITMGFVRLFFKKMNKGVVEVDKEVALSLLQRNCLNVEGHSLFEKLAKGYYVFCIQGKPLGIFLKTKKEIISQVPKSFSTQLKRKLNV